MGYKTLAKKKDSPVLPKKIAIAERRRLAMELRVQGGTFVEIAEALREVEGVAPSYSDELARQDVHHALRKLQGETMALAEQHVHLELARFDAMTAAIWGRAMKGDGFAFDRLLQVSDRRVRLLQSLGMVAKEPPAPAPQVTINAPLGNVAMGGQTVTQALTHEVQAILNMAPDDLQDFILQTSQATHALGGVVSPMNDPLALPAPEAPHGES